MIYRQRLNYRLKKLHYVGSGNGVEHDDVFAYREFTFNTWSSSDKTKLTERSYIGNWKLVRPVKVWKLIKTLLSKRPVFNVDQIKLDITARMNGKQDKK